MNLCFVIQKKNHALHYACQYNFVDIVSQLLEEHGVDVNLRGENGKSGMHFACESGSMQVIEYLLERHDLRIGKDQVCSFCIF